MDDAKAGINDDPPACRKRHSSKTTCGKHAYVGAAAAAPQAESSGASDVSEEESEDGIEDEEDEKTDDDDAWREIFGEQGREAMDEASFDHQPELSGAGLL